MRSMKAVMAPRIAAATTKAESTRGRRALVLLHHSQVRPPPGVPDSADLLIPGPPLISDFVAAAQLAAFATGITVDAAP